MAWGCQQTFIFGWTISLNTVWLHFIYGLNWWWQLQKIVSWLVFVTLNIHYSSFDPRRCCLWELLQIIETAVDWRRCTTRCWQGAKRPAVKLCCTTEHGWASETRTAGTSHTRCVYCLKHKTIIYMSKCVCMHVSVFFGLYSHHSRSLFFGSLFISLCGPQYLY